MLMGDGAGRSSGRSWISAGGSSGWTGTEADRARAPWGMGAAWGAGAGSAVLAELLLGAEIFRVSSERGCHLSISSNRAK